VGPAARARPAPTAHPIRARQQESSWRSILPDQPQRSETTSNTTAALFGVVGVVASDSDERAPGVGAATATSAGPCWDQVPAARPARPGAGGSPARSAAPAARPLLRTQPPPAPTGTARARMTARKA